MFYAHLKAICTKQNTTPTAVVKKLGLSTGKVTAWKNGSIPKIETLKKLAETLSVPVCAFFGGEECDKTASPFQEDALELIGVYQKLRKSGKRQLIGKAYELLDAQDASHMGDTLTPPDTNLAVTVIDSRIKK